MIIDRKLRSRDRAYEEIASNLRKYTNIEILTPFNYKIKLIIGQLNEAIIEINEKSGENPNLNSFNSHFLMKFQVNSESFVTLKILTI